MYTKKYFFTHKYLAIHLGVLLFFWSILTIFTISCAAEQEQNATALTHDVEQHSTVDNYFQQENTENLESMEKVGIHGGRIVFGSIGEASNLIPYLATDTASHDIASLIFVSLLRYDKDLQIEPYAAESYEVADDGKLIRFRLREGILWEDGTEMTSDDVEFTWQIVTDPNTASPYAGDLSQVSEFVKTGRYSFEVRYDNYFSGSLTSWMGAILPKHILEGQNLRDTDFSRNPIGAGPYRLKSWTHGSQTILEASPTYFIDNTPYIQEVVYRIIPDLSTMFLETRAGRLDMMGLTPQQYLRQTIGSPWDETFEKYKYLSSTYLFLGFNMAHSFFQDVNVRRAISHAIDREGIVQGVLMGEGVPAFGPYKPGSWAYHPTLQPPQHNIELAKDLLAQAGFADTDNDGIIEKDGQDFSFTILTNQGNEQRILTAIVIQSQLKDIGIHAEIRTVEWATFINEFINKAQFDAVILAWTITPESDLYDVWHSSSAVPGGLNFTRYINPEVDSILEQARATPSIEQRTTLYHRLQEIFHAEQPYCFLYVPYSLPMLNKRIKGIEPALAGIMHNFDYWWIAD